MQRWLSLNSSNAAPACVFQRVTKRPPFLMTTNSTTDGLKQADSLPSRVDTRGKLWPSVSRRAGLPLREQAPRAFAKNRTCVRISDFNSRCLRLSEVWFAEFRKCPRTVRAAPSAMLAAHSARHRPCRDTGRDSPFVPHDDGEIVPPLSASARQCAGFRGCGPQTSRDATGVRAAVFPLRAVVVRPAIWPWDQGE